MSDSGISMGPDGMRSRRCKIRSLSSPILSKISVGLAFCMVKGGGGGGSDVQLLDKGVWQSGW